VNTWLLAGAFVALIGVFGWSMYRAGYLKGWDGCVRAARERKRRIALDKTVNLERERLLRRRLRRDPS
jgi:hypothetical protein